MYPEKISEKMTQEERQLLIKDLAGRLPYNVVVGCTEDDEPDTFFKCILTGEMLHTIIYKTEYFNYAPFLRPMSSMTEEEKREIYDWLVENDVDWFDFNKLRLDEILISFDSSWLLVDWLNAHHFDYRGLIEKGLALEAPKDRKEDEK